MSRKKLFIETLVFGLIFLAIYIGLGLTVYFTSVWTSENSLRNDLDIAQQIFNGNEAEETGNALSSDFASKEDSVPRISVIRFDEDSYTIVYDSRSMFLSDNGIPLELINLGQVQKRRSSYGYNMYYLAEKDEENPSYIIRASIKESSVTSSTRNYLIWGSLSFAMLLGLYIAYKVHDYYRTFKPLNADVMKLNSLAGNNDEKGVSDLDKLHLSVQKVSSELEEKIDELQEEKEKLHLILDSIDQGFLALDGEGKIILFNRKSEEIFHYKEQDIIDNNYHVLLGDENFNASLDRVLKSHQEISPFEFVSEGRTYQVLIMPLSLNWAKSMNGGAAVLLEDVTEEKNMARIKNDFFTNASHELKSPLTSVIGYLEMINQGIIDDPKEVSKALDSTLKQARRMKEILNDMLTLNRLENNTVPKEKEEIEITSLLQDIINGLAPMAETKNVTFVMNLSKMKVHGVKEDLQRLFTNLLDNAVKYNKQGGKVLVSTKPETKKVVISDTGIGIAEENLPRIFERFYRVDNSRNPGVNPPGSGLGLSIVKHICLEEGIKIEVSSVLEKGTVFTLSF